MENQSKNVNRRNFTKKSSLLTFGILGTGSVLATPTTT